MIISKDLLTASQLLPGGKTMTVDPLVYALAQSRCQASGFDNTVDVQRMAEAIQSAIEDVEADFAKES